MLDNRQHTQPSNHSHLRRGHNNQYMKCQEATQPIMEIVWLAEWGESWDNRFSPPLIEANAELTGISTCHNCTLWL